AALRVASGVMLLAHGLLLKVMTFTVAGTVGWFESVGYPGALAYAVIAAEILGGLALIIGFKTRIVALAMVPILIGATLQHLPFGWVFSAEGGGWEFPAFWTLALLAQAGLGSGTFAVDRMVFGGRTATATA
ncbi:MAG: DoxX family protein, partial [Pseudomonadota bacterium]